ncbi:hypothetical protein IFR05_011792 [Cadophora sp. M221]|nr:hypothetical protein IFR05_011792 [Cadophora sp. M221]
MATPNSRNEAALGTTAPTATNTPVDSADVTRWMELFGYDGTEAMAAILAHRNDPSVHVSDMKWFGVQWGHEKAGYNKESYEHLLVLKGLIKREKEAKARANGMNLHEWVGDSLRISLGGILTLGSLKEILGDDAMGTVDSEEKWCYIERNRLKKDRIFAWIKRIIVAVAKGKASYNKVWKTAIAERGDSTVLARAGFHSAPSSSNFDGNHNTLRVGFVKIDDDRPVNYPLQATTRPRYVQNPFVSRSRLIYSISEMNRLRPSQPPRFLPPQHWASSSLGPALTPWDLVGMDLFWQNYRTDPHIQLPEFGNAPRVFPLPAEVVTILRQRRRGTNLRNHPGRTSEALDSSPTHVTQRLEHRSSTNERLSPWFKRLRKLRRRHLVLQRNAAETAGRSLIHWREVLFGDEPPRKVSSMMIREIVVANALEVSDLDPAIIAISTTPPFPELWSKFYLPPTHPRL